MWISLYGYSTFFYVLPLMAMRSTLLGVLDSFSYELIIECAMFLGISSLILDSALLQTDIIKYPIEIIQYTVLS